MIKYNKFHFHSASVISKVVTYFWQVMTEINKIIIKRQVGEQTGVKITFVCVCVCRFVCL